MIKTISILIVTLSFQSSWASGESLIGHKDHEVRLLQAVKISSDQTLYLSVRNNGHVLGQTFVVETRVSCEGDVENFIDLEVVDSYSVCNLKPDSFIKNTKGTAVALLAKSANINKYYDDIAEGVESPEVFCKKGNEVLKFSLKNHCKKISFSFSSTIG